MMDFMDNLPAGDLRRIEEAAKMLAEFGLGINRPHMHDGADGEVELPDGMTSYERNLQVAFLPTIAVPHSATAVSWRWINGKLSACGHCCAVPPPD